ncbi:MAG: hypothetical protein F6J92_09820 [Symploca sp. SIO1A3]|nr:hypothetical protein [Symploca sp. SIO1A3]
MVSGKYKYAPRFQTQGWYDPDTYYQILSVKPCPKKKRTRINQHIITKISLKKRGTGSENLGQLKPGSFDDFQLDSYTKEKLEHYPKHKNEDILSSYLPSPGVILPKKFIETISGDESDKLENTAITNFYEPTRAILQSRKLSQLVAKTWCSYQEAKKNGDWDKFTAGDWENITSLEILDGLIAREIFLFAGDVSPDKIEHPDIYTPLNPHPAGGEIGYHRFVILPSSKAWEGIALSLLLSGQAYYKNKQKTDDKGKYHQISQPILSTGEIVSKYSFEVNWNIFDGKFKELATDNKAPWIVYQVLLPYPPIPSKKDLDPKHIKKWAYAPDEGGDFPFYITEKNEGKEDGEENIKYLTGIDYFRSPYPYMPLTTS